MLQTEMLQNQVIEELLRERSYYYNSNSKNPDFWLIVSPNDSKKLKLLSKDSFDLIEFPFLSTIITTNYDFYQWIKLRLGYFFESSDDESFIDIKNFQKNQTQNITINGICGMLKPNQLIVFSHNPSLIDPIIRKTKYKLILEAYNRKFLK
jgi:hypothetical protein